MNQVLRFVRLFRGFFRRRREDDETTEELRFHFHPPPIVRPAQLVDVRTSDLLSRVLQAALHSVFVAVLRCLTAGAAGETPARLKKSLAFEAPAERS